MYTIKWGKIQALIWRYVTWQAELADLRRLRFRNDEYYPFPSNSDASTTICLLHVSNSSPILNDYYDSAESVILISVELSD